MIKVLYEDNHIIAVLKPAGLLTQGDRSGDKCLMDDVKDYLKQKYNKPGNVFLGLVHRLDKPVSGIVLFGKTSKGASRLSELFREHTIQKTYNAIVVGKPTEEKGSIKEKVNKISFFAEGFTNKTDEELLAAIKGATKTRTAELDYEVLKSNEKYSLLKILPKTGRFHQIRIQMNQMGCPILGDVKYASDSIVRQMAGDWQNRAEIALSATAIVFKTGIVNSNTGLVEEKEVKLEIPLPEFWKKYI